LAGFGNTKTLFFFSGSGRASRQGQGHEGSGSTSDKGALVHLKYS
jgi:hypothetical protein